MWNEEFEMEEMGRVKSVVNFELWVLSCQSSDLICRYHDVEKVRQRF